MSIYRPEYPRPQMVRDEWINLNGEWEYTFDHGTSGRDRGLPNAHSFDGRINVPFCPESSLSGVAYTDFIASIWYLRKFAVPEEWGGKRVLLHFGAVDFATEVWVNGKSVGTHKGGYSSFAFEITNALVPGENTLIVCADDDVRGRKQPAGKQSDRYHSYGCDYTRTTGIWQTVWLEAVPESYIRSLRITPDVENSCVRIQAKLNAHAEDLIFTAHASLDGKPAATETANVTGDIATITLAIDANDLHLWEPESPTLYDLDLSLRRGEKTVDSVKSYFGMRSLGIRGHALLLNGKPLFQRLILDQGFYPEGIYTAPSDAELKADIERSQAMGFNGARLHEKVFEERFLYWADKLGYIVWGEMANWGMDHKDIDAAENFISEWLEVLERDYSHPSIVGWCPFNETIPHVDGLLKAVYRMTKQIDPIRPVIDTSGYYHTDTTDVMDSHDYEQNPAVLAEHLAPFAEGGEPWIYVWDRSVYPGTGNPPYSGQPFFVSEYGGIWWKPDQKEGENAWGYGDRPKSEEEFIARYKGLTEVLLNHPKVAAFCYTQLTDIEQEVNGLYTYDRKPKFDPEIIRAINTQRAAIEKDN